GPIKPQAEIDADPISRFLARRDARRAAFELDRLLYVAATRAKERLHLVAELCVDARSGDIKPPAAASLLGRLWPVLGDMVPARPERIPNAQPDAPRPAAGETIALKRLPLPALRDQVPPTPGASAANARSDVAAPS